MSDKKLKKYKRIESQLKELFIKTDDPISRMSTIAAVLHNKFSYFFWTGFYRLIDGKLIVGPYQGSLACLLLKEHTGVCWAGIDKKEALVISDVEAFPGHIACDSRSKSEVVVPIRNSQGEITAILDVDSDELNSFDETDREGLELICKLIYS